MADPLGVITITGTINGTSNQAVYIYYRPASISGTNTDSWILLGSTQPEASGDPLNTDGDQNFAFTVALTARTWDFAVAEATGSDLAALQITDSSGTTVTSFSEGSASGNRSYYVSEG